VSRVVEGTMTNVFVSPREGVLLTPDLSRAGVAGVMRRHILERAAGSGMQVRVTELPLAELMQANEVFLCNSLIGVWPVSELDGHSYAVGSVTRQAQRWVDAC
jgi:4-amino-4-deoxychorismate lyase